MVSGGIGPAPRPRTPEGALLFGNAGEKPEWSKDPSRAVFKFFKKEMRGEIEVEVPYVSVCGVELEVNTEGEGSQFTEAQFRNFSFDDMSLDLLRRYAISAKLDQPPLIEGETDIGKTSALEYLALLTNHHLLRINFSGQSDVSELIGRFVPASETARQKFLRAIANPKSLSESSRGLIEAARADNRSLTEDESQQIAVAEGMLLGESKWEWQDGILPRGGKFNNGRGTWMLFDEMGGAAPSILLRANQPLDPGPPRRLSITERGGMVVEFGPEARMFSTTNPPEYAGNEPFRPDYLRRWNYQSLGALDQKTIDTRLARVMRGIFPEHPMVREAIREALVEFHAKARELVKTLLKQRQQFRYEFSDLMRVVAYVDEFGKSNPLRAMGEAVQFYYINKFKDPAAQDILRAKMEEVVSLKGTVRLIEDGMSKGERQRQEQVREVKDLRDRILGNRATTARLPQDIRDLLEQVI